MRRLLTALCGVALAGGLVACGGDATVDNAGAPSSVAPLTRENTKESSTESSSDSTSSSLPAPAREPSQGGEDRGAREVQNAPEAQHRTEEERQFLDALTKEGLDVKDLEDTLVASAQNVCGNPEQSGTLINAVAGQLVEQQRTSKSVEDVASLIEKTAQKAYC
ncbi:DUF732 domain-containing protein [Corynebacterium uropygiale]|uniref:DUF732 domain-containing protein n=1 Tax=Corynebacterium uropygiale TaxID=1775911 RepID=A0A9X1QT83_9CORY|nr:DUF732 domain-containing protein [Corynebacterium uropygiale]MCF4007333.1 DUF732 domain-containing protein [Corynebacterium uropygiale]